MNIPQKIAEYIAVKGITQAEISEKLNVTRQNLNRMLNADDMKVSVLIELCRILDVNPGYFFDGTEAVNNEVLERCIKRNAELEEMLLDKRKIIQEKEESEITGYLNKTEKVLLKFFTFSDQDRARLLTSIRERIVQFKQTGRSGIHWLCNFDNEEDVINLINDQRKKLASKPR